MERSSIDNIVRKAVDFYVTLFRRNPLWVSVILLLSMLVYVIVLEVMLAGRITGPISLLRGFLQKEPRLEIVIQPAEKYEIGGTTLTVKRIALANHAYALSNVKITIRTADSIENVKVNVEPEVRCRSTTFGPSEGRILLDILCDSFTRDQRVEIRLATTRRGDEGSTVVVEATGSYGRDRLVGASASGRLYK